LKFGAKIWVPKIDKLDVKRDLNIPVIDVDKSK
jgi:hypothetical protein